MQVKTFTGNELNQAASNPELTAFRNFMKSTKWIDNETYTGIDRRMIYFDPGGATNCIGCYCQDHNGNIFLEDLPKRRKEDK